MLNCNHGDPFPLTLVTLAVVNEVAGAAEGIQNNVEVLLDPIFL